MKGIRPSLVECLIPFFIGLIVIKVATLAVASMVVGFVVDSLSRCECSQDNSAFVVTVGCFMINGC